MTNPRDDLMALAARVEKLPAYSGKDLGDVHLFRIDDTDETNPSDVEVLLIDAARRTIITDALRLAASRPATQVVDSEAVAQAVTSELEKMHKDGVPMCMREGEATWRTYFVGFDLSMFAIRISDAILSLLRPAKPVEAEGVEKPVAWRKALEFYADPFAWKKKHDPENDVQVPDFYSETSFGDMASEALATHPPAQPDTSAKEMREALLDATANLVGAASAYRKHAARHRSIGRAIADPFFTTRAVDLEKAAERAQAAIRQLPTESKS